MTPQDPEEAFVRAILEAERDAQLSDVRVPSAGQMWWRLELRARQEAAEKAARPITIATGVAAAAIAGVCASVAPAAWFAVRAVITSAPSGPWLALAVAAGALVVATPIAVYVALRD